MVDQPIHLELRMAAAKLALGILHSWELPPLADAALNHGVYSPALDKLAHTADPVMSDVEPMFRTAMIELSIQIPAREPAVFLVLSQYLESIVDGSLPPYDGLHRMMQDLYYGANLYEGSKEYTGELWGIQYLIGAYYGYDDLRERPREVSYKGNYGAAAIADFDTHVIELCRQWLNDNAGRENS